jgi:hypothetical protein
MFSSRFWLIHDCFLSRFLPFRDGCQASFCQKFELVDVAEVSKSQLDGLVDDLLVGVDQCHVWTGEVSRLRRLQGQRLQVILHFASHLSTQVSLELAENWPGIIKRTMNKKQFNETVSYKRSYNIPYHRLIIETPPYTSNKKIYPNTIQQCIIFNLLHQYFISGPHGICSTWSLILLR